MLRHPSIEGKAPALEDATGKITIDANHNAKKSAVIIGVKDGKFVYQATVPDPDQPLKM